MNINIATNICLLKIYHGPGTVLCPIYLCFPNCDRGSILLVFMFPNTFVTGLYNRNEFLKNEMKRRHSKTYAHLETLFDLTNKITLSECHESFCAVSIFAVISSGPAKSQAVYHTQERPLLYAIYHWISQQPYGQSKMIMPISQVRQLRLGQSK